MNCLSPILVALFVALVSSTVAAADIYVSPEGRDSQPGTKEQPLATLEAARDAARRAKRGPHRILVLPGDYYLEKTLQLDPRDNGLTIEAAGPEPATLYGGRRVTNWRPDGEKFWSADLPGVREGKWDFRALVVNDRLATQARLPEAGTFWYRSTYNCVWTPGGDPFGSAPTREERSTLLYDPKDLPPTLDVRNAELLLGDLDSRSGVRLLRNDRSTHRLHLATDLVFRPSGLNTYVILNTREGMTRPGQWYLDRTRGRVVYWPLPGEDVKKAKIIAPVLEEIIAVGTRKLPAERITLRGLGLQATTKALGNQGPFGAAVMWYSGRRCTADRLEIANVAHVGIGGGEMDDCQITHCHLYNLGGCGISISGSGVLVAGNRLHHVGGRYAAISVSSRYRTAQDKGTHVYGNEIRDAPGLQCEGGGHRIEENLLSGVRGVAVNVSSSNSVFRGNIVRDPVKTSEHEVRTAFYLDQACDDCTIEHNTLIGFDRPVHLWPIYLYDRDRPHRPDNAPTRNLLIRDNIFVSQRDLVFSLREYKGGTFSGNRIFAPGKVMFVDPKGMEVWRKNLRYRKATDPPQEFSIHDLTAANADPIWITQPVKAARRRQPPRLEGESGWKNWPGEQVVLDRRPEGEGPPGPPAFARLAYDDRYLYVAVDVPLYNPTQLRKGTAWGKDDGAEFSIAGPEGIFVLRGYAGGACQSIDIGGVSRDAAARLGGAARFVATTYGPSSGITKGGWRGMWTVPLDAVGLKPVADREVPFNLAVFRAEDEAWRCLEQGIETWDLANHAGRLEWQ